MEGQELRAFRERHRLTQEALAAEYGLTAGSGRAYISKLERGAAAVPARLARWMRLRDEKSTNEGER